MLPSLSSYHKLLGVLTASALAFSTTGCILAQDDVKENNKTANMSPNQSSNAGANMNANNGSPLSCDSACGKLWDTCPRYVDLLDAPTCQEVCNNEFNNETLECIADAPTCAQIETCVEEIDLTNTDPGNFEPGNVDPGNFEPGNNATTCTGDFCIDPSSGDLLCIDPNTEPNIDPCSSCGQACPVNSYCGIPHDFDANCMNADDPYCLAYECHTLECEFDDTTEDSPYSNCPSDSEGEQFLVCHANADGDRQSSGFCGTPCSSDNDCKRLTRCDDDARRCVPKTQPPVRCTTTNEECLCIGVGNSSCFKRCETSSECGGGEACNTDLGVCTPSCMNATECSELSFGANMVCERTNQSGSAFCRRQCMGDGPTQCPPGAQCSEEGFCGY